MQLRDLLDEVATATEPPSRLDADTVFAAGARRRRRQLATTIGTAAVAVVAGAALALTVTAPARGPDAPTGPDAAGPSLEGSRLILSVTGHDRNHLYAVARTCAGCPFELLATANGGKTWTRRNASDLMVSISPRMRVTRSGHIVATGAGVVPWNESLVGTNWAVVSTDGGRGFRTLGRATRPVDGAPPDSEIYCTQADWSKRTCAVDVVDADTYAPLAAQPALATLEATRDPNGQIWAIGLDPGTSKPAVANSTDAGRTWTTHVFTGAEPTTVDPRRFFARLLAVNGVVYARFTASDDRGDPVTFTSAVFRLVDGAWQRLATDDRQDHHLWESEYVTADGDLVFPESAEPPTPGTPRPQSAGPAAFPPPATTRFWSWPIGADGYRQIDPPKGLGSPGVWAVRRLAGGGYIASGFTGAFGSSDGRTWQPIRIG